MNIRLTIAVATMAGSLQANVGSAAESAAVNVLCANGMQTVMEELGPKFERETGHKLAMTFGTGGATVKRAADDEAADVVIAIAQGIEGLMKEGKAVAD